MHHTLLMQRRNKVVFVEKTMRSERVWDGMKGSLELTEINL